MFDQLSSYTDRGSFTVLKGTTLKQVCNAPEKPGIYLIYSLCKGSIDLIYIGSSGTIKQDGSFRDQLLCGRINNKQNGMYRQQLFQEEIELNDYDALQIEWFVTFNKDTQHLPSFVEATLLQAYFQIYQCLPHWNKEF